MSYSIDAGESPNGRAADLVYRSALQYEGLFDSIGKALTKIDPTKKNTVVGKIVGTATKIATAPTLLTKGIQDTAVRVLGKKSVAGTIANNFFKTVNPVQNFSETAATKGLGKALKTFPAELVSRPYQTANAAAAATLKAVAPKNAKAKAIARMVQSSGNKAQKWGEAHPYQTAAIGAAAVAGGFAIAAAAPAGGFFASSGAAAGAGGAGGAAGAGGAGFGISGATIAKSVAGAAIPAALKLLQKQKQAAAGGAPLPDYGYGPGITPQEAAQYGLTQPGQVGQVGSENTIFGFDPKVLLGGGLLLVALL